MSASISVIVVNYNAGNLLRGCVDSILSCPVNVEIVVVDNASQDNSLEALAGLAHVQIIKNPRNAGFASACNTGLRASSAPYVLFLNPDCSFKPGALAELVKALESNPKVGMVGGLLTNVDGSEQIGARRAIPTPWRSFVRAFGLVNLSRWWPNLFFDFNLHQQPMPDHPVPVEAISGACMMVKRDVMNQVGEWDDGYFLHCEDLDWCMRFRERGWEILFVPSAVITHVLGFCGRNRPVFVEWHKHRGMMRFYRKFFKEHYPGALMWLVGVGVWLRFSIVAASFATRQFSSAAKRFLF